MHNKFIFSDPHFYHDKIYGYKDKKGALIRPWAKDATEGDEIMIDSWNALVTRGDTVYVLGDVAIKAKGLALLDRMNGRKVLIRGNHDIFRINQYLKYFADIRGTHKINKLILSHYPIHPGSIPHWCDANVHGHTHNNLVMRQKWIFLKRPDPRYINACVERLGTNPVPVEELEMRAMDQRKCGRVV